MTGKIEKFKWKEVNDMNMPGFTAEASIYQPTGHYAMRGAPLSYSSSLVELAQIINFLEINLPINTK
jgi:hypothetical protein